MAGAHGFTVNYSFGSLTAISDATGNLVESLSYDPWGRRRNPSNWNDYNVTSTMFDRGFTGHEHLAQFGLINMNGRVYDPFLARFLSPDPFVQAPDYSQNFNRYSYCLNNPLKYVDPSGNSFMDVVEGFVNFLTFPGRVLSEGTAMLNDHINGRPQQEGYFHWDYLTGNAAPYDIPQSNVYFAIDYSGFLDWSGGPFTDASGSNWDYGWEVFDFGPFDSDFVYSNGSKGTAFNGKVFQFMRPYFKEVNNGNLNAAGQGGGQISMDASHNRIGFVPLDVGENYGAFQIANYRSNISVRGNQNQITVRATSSNTSVADGQVVFGAKASLVVNGNTTQTQVLANGLAVFKLPSSQNVFLTVNGGWTVRYDYGGAAVPVYHPIFWPFSLNFTDNFKLK